MDVFLNVEEKNKTIDNLSDLKNRANARSKSESTWNLREPIRSGPKLRPDRLFRSLRLPSKLPLRAPDFNREKEIKLTNSISKNILDVYTESNKKLEKLTATSDLKKHEYY